MDSRQKDVRTEEPKEQERRRPYEKPTVEYVALTPEERLMGCQDTSQNNFVCTYSS